MDSNHRMSESKSDALPTWRIPYCFLVCCGLGSSGTWCLLIIDMKENSIIAMANIIGTRFISIRLENMLLLQLLQTTTTLTSVTYPCHL